MWKLLLLFLFVSVSAKFRFDNYTLYRIVPENLDQVKLLQNLHETDQRYDFWSDPVPKAKFVNILSSPEDKSDLDNFLSKNGLKSEITLENIQEVIEKESVKKYNRNNLRSMTWDAYYTLEDIYEWLDDLALNYPTLVTVLIGGHTYEDREIKGVKISHGGSGKRAIFIESGIHSREWISPSTACYIINDLLTSENEETMAAARDFDWYIFPVTNPDGYVYTHTTFRLWRKNRQPYGLFFYGVDLNRNWNSNWLVAGSSTLPLLDTYAGPGPFSEPETRSFSQFIRTIGHDLDIYISFHSYSQLIMLPFGNSTEQYANYDEAMSIGRRAAGALSVRYGTQYEVGNIAETIYEATGGSVDWVKEQFNVPLAFCYELRDLGQSGFLLPAEQILPNHLETMDSILEIIHQGKRFGVLRGHGFNIKSSFVLTLVAVITTFL